MDPRIFNWGIFVLLSLTWGSSFILMKLGLDAFTAYQVASLRLIAAGVSLLPFSFRYIRQTPVDKLPVIILSGLIGNAIPAYLFCIAETQIDSSLAGMLNALTPVWALIFGLLIFGVPATRWQVAGLALGFGGVIGLFLAKGVQSGQSWSYGGWVVLATVCYGLNIHLVRQRLQGLPSLQVVSVSLFFMALFALPVLLYGDFIARCGGSVDTVKSLAASATLGIMGTGIASVLFYRLIRSAGPMFASMVTYGLPVVAIGWGLLAGEQIGGLQLLCLLVIMSGVYLVNRK